MPRILSQPSTKSFHFNGDKGSVLLLHGFTGSPYELTTIGEALDQAGFSGNAPLLPGHGQTPEILNQFTAESWYEAARTAFLNLPKQKPRIVIGFSMGALLAVMLAAEFKSKIDKLVLLAPAFYLKPYGRLALWLVRLGIGKKYFIKKILKGGDILDSESRSKNPNYNKTPLKALFEFGQIAQTALTDIKNISCPTFAAFGTQDHTIDVKKSAKALNQNITSPFKIHFFTNSAHIIPLDFERDELIEQILKFCKSNE
ncbi:MAG: alpha/beta fold hydrolase [bacterium]|nr:alpha/beta fold hydrolase [bacterium]